MKTAEDTTRIRFGFHLEEHAVVVCRQQETGWWEAWIEKEGTPLKAEETGRFVSFFGPSRFKAQCKASRWYGEQVARRTLWQEKMSPYPC